MKRIFTIFSLILILSGFSIQLKAAFNPPPPVTHTVAKAMDALSIGVYWAYKYDPNIDPNELPDYFNIYLAAGQVKDKSLMTKIGKVDFSANQYEYKYLIEQLKGGVYTILVSAVNEHQGAIYESERNAFAYASINSEPKDYVKILLKDFPKQLEAGKYFKYLFTAESNVKCPIEFNIKTNLPGQWETNLLGEIMGTPDKNGAYFISVEAYLTCKTEVRTHLTLQVIVGHVEEEPQPCVAVSGTVAYEDGTYAESGTVIAWEVSKNDKRPIFKSPIQNGGYHMKLPEGIYIFELVGGDFEHEWHKDVKEPAHATRVELKCAHDQKIDFIVAKFVHPEKIEVKGRVTNGEGEPLFAHVFFESLYKKDANNHEQLKFETKTDKDGYYKAYLPEAFAFRALATAADKTYIPEFWEDALVPEEADIIYVIKDMEPINFVLENSVEKLSAISGKVTDLEGEIVGSTVIAYQIKNNKDSKERFMRVVHTNDAGEYELINLPYGNFTLLSLPDKKEYLPGYYQENSVVTLKWKESDPVSVTEENPFAIANPVHEKFVKLQGLGEFSGYVKTLDIDYIKPIAEKTGNDKIMGEGLQLEGVMATMRLNGVVAGYDVTDAEGAFVVAELEPGEYTLTVDKPGFKSITSNITVDYDKNMKNSSDFNLEADETTSIPTETLNAAGVYPIPANEILTIEFEAAAGKANVEVVELSGKTVLTTEVETIAGLNKVSIDLRSLNAGTYYIRILSGGKLMTAPVNVVK